MKRLYIIWLVFSFLLTGSVGRIGMDTTQNNIKQSSLELTSHSCCKQTQKKSNDSENNCCQHQISKICCCYVFIPVVSGIELPITYQYLMEQKIYGDKKFKANYHNSIFHPPIV